MNLVILKFDCAVLETESVEESGISMLEEGTPNNWNEAIYGEAAYTKLMKTEKSL